MLEFVTRISGFGHGEESGPVASSPQPRPRPKIGLALGGGAARGWAHIGVLQVFQEAGIRFDVIAGTSIGAVAGGCFAAGRLGELEDFARSLNKRKLIGLLDFNLKGTSLINGEKLSGLLTHGLENMAIEDLPTPFTCVATEVGTGHEVWLSRGPLARAMTASYALPGIFRPQRIGNRWLMDGTLVNPVPVSACRAMDAHIVVSINLNDTTFGRGTVLHQPENIAENIAEVEEIETSKNRKSLAEQWFSRGDAASPPGVSTVMMDALNIMQDRISRSRLAGDPPDIAVSPRVSHIGLYDFHLADEIIALGRKAAKRALPDLKNLMALTEADGV